MKPVIALVAIAIALVAQAAISRLTVGGTVALDLALVVVTYLALIWGPLAGMLAGSAAGLLQDTLGSGVIGIGGLAKTIVGYLAGVVAQQFILTAPAPRFVIFMGATLVHAVVFIGFYTLLGLRSFPSPLPSVVAQAAGNGVIGLGVFLVVERLPPVIERRRTRRRRSR